MPTCYVLIGPPGCGKTTWREANMGSMNAPVVISSDDLAEEMSREQGITYHDFIQSMDYQVLVKKLSTKVVRAVMAGSDVILDQTNYTPRKRRLFRRFFPATYKVVGVQFEFDPDEIKQRVKEREARTGKHVPVYVLDEMMREYIPPKPGEFDEVIVVPRGS